MLQIGFVPGLIVLQLSWCRCQWPPGCRCTCRVHDMRRWIADLSFFISFSTSQAPSQSLSSCLSSTYLASPHRRTRPYLNPSFPKTARTCSAHRPLSLHAQLNSTHCRLAYTRSVVHAHLPSALYVAESPHPIPSDPIVRLSSRRREVFEHKVSAPEPWKKKAVQVGPFKFFKPLLLLRLPFEGTPTTREGRLRRRPTGGLAVFGA